MTERALDAARTDGKGVDALDGRSEGDEPRAERATEVHPCGRVQALGRWRVQQARGCVARACSTCGVHGARLARC
eukprot:3108861-Prymnesium_polylepis.2